MDQIAQVIQTLGSQWIAYQYTQMIVNNLIACAVVGVGLFGAYKFIKKMVEV